MSKLIVPYVDEQSNVFNKIKRPKLSLSVYSRCLKCWVKIEDVLADTGADISVLPRSLGILIVGDYKSGDKFKISGLLSKIATEMYIHKLSIKLAEKTMRTYFAISSTDDTPPTLGRVGGLDKFDIRYLRGREIIIHW